MPTANRGERHTKSIINKFRTVMKSLNWAMLKEKIEQMNEQEQQEPVRVWGEEISLKSEITLDRTNENMYYNDDFDGVCYPESELDDYKPEECTLVAKTGTYYLDID